MLYINRQAAPKNFIVGKIASNIYSLNATVTTPTSTSMPKSISLLNSTSKSIVTSNSTSIPNYNRITDQIIKGIQTKTLKLNDVNQLMKILGKKYKFHEIFIIFDYLLSLNIVELLPNNESYEILSNSMIKSVNEEKTATSMKDLPKPKISMPEVSYFACFKCNFGFNRLLFDRLF